MRALPTEIREKKLCQRRDYEHARGTHGSDEAEDRGCVLVLSDQLCHSAQDNDIGGGAEANANQQTEGDNQAHCCGEDGNHHQAASIQDRAGDDHLPRPETVREEANQGQAEDQVVDGEGDAEVFASGPECFGYRARERGRSWTGFRN